MLDLDLFFSFQIDEKEREAEIVKKFYDLIDLYEVPVPPEDLAEYQVFFIFPSSCSSNLSKRLEL